MPRDVSFSAFRVGVMVRSHAPDSSEGYTGRIEWIPPEGLTRPNQCVIVELDDFDEGHDCDGVSPSENGWWIEIGQLTVLNEKHRDDIELQVGDVVVSLAPDRSKGLQGKVIKIISTPKFKEINVAVDFGNNFNGHDCDGILLQETGYWVEGRDLLRVGGSLLNIKERLEKSCLRIYKG